MWFESCPVTTPRWMLSIGWFLSIVVNINGFRWIVNCPKPEIKDGNIIPDKPQYAAGYLVNITCYDGYTLIENDFLKCHEDGTWSRSQPYCEELRCPKLLDIHGLKQSNKSSIGGYIQFECGRGLVMIGNDTLHCNKNGTWVPNVMPYCRDITCQKLPQIMNGTVKLKTLPKIQTMAEFGCYQGFVLVGPRTLECGMDGIWTPDRMPRCDEEGSLSTDIERHSTVLEITSLSLFSVSTILLVIVTYLYIKRKRRSKRSQEGQVQWPMVNQPSEITVYDERQTAQTQC